MDAYVSLSELDSPNKGVANIAENDLKETHKDIKQIVNSYGNEKRPNLRKLTFIAQSQFNLTKENSPFESIIECNVPETENYTEDDSLETKANDLKECNLLENNTYGEPNEAQTNVFGKPFRVTEDAPVNIDVYPLVIEIPPLDKIQTEDTMNVKNSSVIEIGKINLSNISQWMGKYKPNTFNDESSVYDVPITSDSENSASLNVLTSPLNFIKSKIMSVFDNNEK